MSSPFPPPAPGGLVSLVLSVVEDLGRLRAIAKGLGLRSGGAKSELAARIVGSVGATLPELTELVRLLRKAELGLLCGRLGLPATGDRGDLLDRVEDRLEQQVELAHAPASGSSSALATPAGSQPGLGARDEDEDLSWAVDLGEEEEDEDEGCVHALPLFPVLLAVTRPGLAALATTVGLSPRGRRRGLHMRLCVWAGRRADRVEAVLGRLTTADLRRAADLLELRASGPREQVLARLRACLAAMGVGVEAAPPRGAAARAELIAGRWALGSVLRTEARGVVREAADLRLPERPGRHVAIVAARASDRRLRLEVELGLRLAHPHAVRVVDAGVDAAGHDVAILVDPGLPLSTWWEQHAEPVDEAVAARWILTLAAALDAAHAVGLLHGSLDRDAVWIDARNEARVGGFTLAVPAHLHRRSSGPGVVDLGGGLGDDPPNAAPETRTAGFVSPASDCWGLARLAAMLLGYGAPSHPDDLPEADPLPGVGDALAAGLDPDPRRRPATCLALAMSLVGRRRT